MILCQLEEVLQAQAYILFYKRISVKQEKIPPLISSDSESSESLTFTLESEETFKYSLLSEDTVKYSLNSEDTVQVGVDGNLLGGSKSSPSVLSKKAEKPVLENSAKKDNPMSNIVARNENSVEDLTRSDTFVLENSTDTMDSVSVSSSIQGTRNSLETKTEKSPRSNSKYPVTRSQTGSLKRSLDNDDVYIYGEYMYPKKVRRRSTDSAKLPTEKNSQNQNNSSGMLPSKFYNVKDSTVTPKSEPNHENNFVNKTVAKKPKVYDAEHIIQELNTTHVLKRRKSTFW